MEGRERGVEPAQVVLPQAARAALHRRALPRLHRGLQDRGPQHAAPRPQEALQVGKGMGGTSNRDSDSLTRRSFLSKNPNPQYLNSRLARFESSKWRSRATKI